MRDPKKLTGGANDLLDQRSVSGRDAGAGEQGGDALAHQCRGVGHAAHHALSTDPAADAVRANAGGHRQVQSLTRVWHDWNCGFAEHLGLHSPDDQVGLDQGRMGAGQGADAKVSL